MINPQMTQKEIRELPVWDIGETTDYHNFSYRGSSVEHRKRLGIGNVYLNAATCHCCGYFIRSRNRHDFVRCRCGKVAVDGGSHYAKRVGELGSYTNHIEMYEDIE